MGSLFRRIDRLVKAELNYSKREIDTDKAAMLAGAGGVAGASIGKIGILAKGTGFSVGTVPLTAAGALTGLALDEAIRVVMEEDTSSVGAAAMGAAAGAGVSAAVGNVGIAAGGTAIGVGMAPMVAAGAVVGLGIASLTKLLQQGVDPEKLLDLACQQMQEELTNLRQSTISIMTAQKGIQRQYEQAQSEVEKWQQRAKFALRHENEYLARLALERKKSCAENLSQLKALLDQQTALIDKLKHNLFAFDAKLSEAKAMKPLLKARLAAAKATANLQSMDGHFNTSSAMAAFERMEEKILMQEARAQSAVELVSRDLEARFAALEASSDVDDELAALKTQMLLPGCSPDKFQTPQQTMTPQSHTGNEVVDAELETLRKQLEGL
jgi:phage shock protein A